MPSFFQTCGKCGFNWCDGGAKCRALYIPPGGEQTLEELTNLIKDLELRLWYAEETIHQLTKKVGLI